MFEFVYEEATGILCVRVLGLWTMAEVERYGHEAAGQFAAARSRSGMLRLLVDCSAGYVCPRDLVEPLARVGMKYHQDGDRVAVVMSSSLVKLQVRRMMEDGPRDMFGSHAEAQAWLTASAGDVTFGTAAAA